MTETHTYWISIGRNAGTKPMTTAEWHAFHADVRGIVFEHGGTILSTVHGESLWDGQAEETTLVLAQLPAASVPAVRALLAELAGFYHQDAIGFVGGHGTETVVWAR